MFDLLFNAKKAERRPIEMMFVAIFYSSISILVGFWIFPEYASLIAVFFTVLSCMYITQKAIRNEEEKEEYYEEFKLLSEHKNILKMFVFLFIGIVIAFSFWTFFLPNEHSSILFSVQKTVLEGIRGSVTGNAISSGEVFKIIFENNLKVLFLSLLISLIYGAGAIFVLTWNASVMGYVIGSIANEHGAISFPMAFLKYFIHGIPEMLSYFIVILAGGLIYAAFIRGDLSEEHKVKKIVFDVLTLILIGIVLMVFAALIETYVSSLI